MTSLSSAAVIIPAYCPSPEIHTLAANLSALGFGLVLVVDDGSPPDYEPVFRHLKELRRTQIISHAENEGKGAALKTAFVTVQAHYPKITHIVTADADGQHQSPDIQHVAEASLEKQNAIVLGSRKFHTDVPLRSKFGNILTRWVFRLFGGLAVSDTQTGLRGIPVSWLPEIEAIDADRYEYEMEVILKASKAGMPIKEVPIATIYIDENASSHFRPVIDSLRIYFVFFRYCLVSLLSFILDIGLFVIFLQATDGNILLSTYSARSLSGSFNFFANRSAVFRAGQPKKLIYQTIGYVTLAIFIATLSGLGVSSLASITTIHTAAIKVMVDIILFITSFLAQRYLIFRPT